jgi:hypothetical protein
MDPGNSLMVKYDLGRYEPANENAVLLIGLRSRPAVGKFDREFSGFRCHSTAYLTLK